MDNRIKTESIEKNDVSEFINFSNFIKKVEISPFKMIHFILRPNSMSIKDQHHSKEYWFIFKGNGELFIDALEPIEVCKGQLFFFDSMTSHQIKNMSKNEDLEILSIWW